MEINNKKAYSQQNYIAIHFKKVANFLKLNRKVTMNTNVLVHSTYIEIYLYVVNSCKTRATTNIIQIYIIIPILAITITIYVSS